jgi:acyl carrier protein phosphodiesterase
LHYRSTSGINQTLSQMAQRTRFDSGMEKSGEVLSRLYPQLQNGFDDFFPQLVAYAERQRQPPTRETKPVNSQAEPALAS